MSGLFALISILSIVAVARSNDFQCMGEQADQHLDWFIVYKLPKKADTGLFNGRGSVFVHSDQADRLQWLRAQSPMDLPGHAVYNTLRAHYDDWRNVDNLQIFYSNQPPHFRRPIDDIYDKGLILSRASSAFWMVHSVPGFPRYNQYHWPEKADNASHMIVCLTVTAESVDSIAKQLAYQQPLVYYSHVPDSWNWSKGVKVVLRERPISKQPFYRFLDTLSTVGGVPLVVASKLAAANITLYVGLLAPSTQRSYRVWARLTWPCQTMQSHCVGSYHVENVLQRIELPTGFGRWPIDDHLVAINCTKESTDDDMQTLCTWFKARGGQRDVCPRTDYLWYGLAWTFASSLRIYNEDEDAIWALGMRPNYWCIGSLRRWSQQDEWNGGAVCMASAAVWQLFAETIRNSPVDSCSKQ